MRTVLKNSKLNNNEFFDYNLRNNERIMDLLKKQPQKINLNHNRDHNVGSYKSKFNKKITKKRKGKKSTKFLL